MDFLERVEEIRESLEEIDREIADQIRPLALIYDGFDVDGKGTNEQKLPGDSLSNNFVFQMVIDKICKLNLLNPGLQPGQKANQTPGATGSVEWQKQYRKNTEDHIKHLQEALNIV